MDEEERRDRRWEKLQARPKAAGGSPLGALGAMLSPGSSHLIDQARLDEMLVADDHEAGAPPVPGSGPIDFSDGVVVITPRREPDGQGPESGLGEPEPE